MTDPECVRFLHWALPGMGLRWAGYRRIRRRVCKRIRRRIQELQLPDTGAYRDYLLSHAVEWARLEALCRVTISRFCRDKQAFRILEEEVLPCLAEAALARHEARLRTWSAGCASGEEPYTLAMLWRLALLHRYPGLDLDILATDVDPELLRRARRACYSFSSIKNLPPSWRAEAFTERAGEYCLRAAFRKGITLQCHDIRDRIPTGPFDLILCRNLAFTYFVRELQQRIATHIVAALQPGGVLVVGSHEKLPPLEQPLTAWSERRQGIYRKPVPAMDGAPSGQDAP